MGPSVGGEGSQGLEKPERKGNSTKHTGIEPSKSLKLVGIQHQRGGCSRRLREQQGVLGLGRGAKGRHPCPCRPHHCQASFLAIESLLRGGIGCKQAPEYCLTEPATAQRDRVRGKEVATAAAQSLLGLYVPPSGPFSPLIAKTGPAASKVTQESSHSLATGHPPPASNPPHGGPESWTIPPSDN